MSRLHTILVSLALLLPLFAAHPADAATAAPGPCGLGGCNQGSSVLAAALGDSIMQYNCDSNFSFGSVNSDNYYASGPINWVQALSGGRVYMPCDQKYDYDFGVVGSTEAQWIASQLPAVLATPAQLVFMNISRNGILNTYCIGTMTAPATISYLEGEYLTIFRALLSAGKSIVLVPLIQAPIEEYSGSGCSSSGTQLIAQQIAWTINQWARELASQNPPTGPTAGSIADLLGRGAFIFVDPTQSLADPSSQTGYGMPQMWNASNQLHYGIQAAYIIGRAMWDALKGYYPSVPNKFNLADTFDATNNLYGNMLTNGQLAGANGTIFNLATGQIADNWTFKHWSGSATDSVKLFKQMLFTPGAVSGPTEVQVMQIQPGSNGANPEEFRIYPSSAISSGFSVGTRLVFGCYIQSSGSPNVFSVSTLLEEDANGSAVYDAWGFTSRSLSGAEYPMPNVPWGGWIQNSGMVVVTGTAPLTIQPYIDVKMSGVLAGGNLTLWIGPCSLSAVQ